LAERWSGIEWQETRHAGVSLSWLLPRAAGADAVVLIRMEPGHGYPPHRHVGEETVFVLQGGYRDQAGEYREGARVVNAAGSVHGPVALDGAEACILLAVARGGVELLDGP